MKTLPSINHMLSYTVTLERHSESLLNFAGRSMTEAATSVISILTPKSRHLCRGGRAAEDRNIYVTMLNETETLRSDPHLSIVAVSRNDDHGGDMLGRMQHFVNGFIAQCRKHHLNAELILVEWNPPPDRPPLEDVLEWPEDFGPATVRIVTVPPSVHAQLPHSDALPLFQMIGKNAGIRRARGRYVLATNIDILLDDATVIYLRDRLSPGIMLRADRYDVPGDLTKGVPFDQVLAECRTRCFQINTRFGILDVERRRIISMDDGVGSRLLALYNEIRIFGLADPISRVAGKCLRLVPNSAKVLRRMVLRLAPDSAKALRRMVTVCFASWRIALRQIVPILRHSPDIAMYLGRRLLRAVASIPRRLVSAQKLFVKATRLMWPSGLFRKHSPAERRLARSRRLHTWACGDFTLLAREDWFLLRGYPEWPMYSWHIDSALMFAANAHEIREMVLGPQCHVYHIDHSVGSGWSLAGQEQLFSRLKSRGIPFLTDKALRDWQNRAAENPADVIVNRPVWGFARLDLPERFIPAHEQKGTIARASRAKMAAEV
jgi:hypothetical protein